MRGGRSRLGPPGIASTGGRLTAIALIALLVATLAACTGRSSARQAPALAYGSMPAHRVPLGAFLGSGVDGTDRFPGFAAFLGTEPTVGHTYLPGGTWRAIEGQASILDPWTAWRRAKADRTLVLNVPMVAPNEPAMPDDEVVAALTAGADGAFDAHFRTLAQRLVSRGAPDTVIVLGWEMNGTTYSSRCGPDPSAWKRYWQRIVATMRSVPGQRFRFDFAPVRGAQNVPWTQCYPGDDVVDIIGMDSYDQGPGRTFVDFVRQPYGMATQAEFAAAHGKPMSYPEWGLFDFGDNPDYIRAMYAWISTHDVAYQTITDYCPHGVWECRSNPESSRVYRQLFGVRAGRSTPPGR